MSKSSMHSSSNASSPSVVRTGETLKQRARQIQKENPGMRYTSALELAAREKQHDSWHAACATRSDTSQPSPGLPARRFMVHVSSIDENGGESLIGEVLREANDEASAGAMAVEEVWDPRLTAASCRAAWNASEVAPEDDLYHFPEFQAALDREAARLRGSGHQVVIMDALDLGDLKDKPGALAAMVSVDGVPHMLRQDGPAGHFSLFPSRLPPDNAVECGKCGSVVVNGYCEDETCPYSDWPQQVPLDDMYRLPAAEIERKYGILKRRHGNR